MELLIYISSSEPESQTKRKSLIWTLIFGFLVAAYCLWVFSLPLFPSQDGPVHLYYTSIISNLLSGSSLFSQFFAVRHPIPPYSSHYLLLTGLTKAFGPLAAEKCVVCLIIVLFCYGLLYVINSIDNPNQIVAIFAVPLSLNWSVGMGFHNYCLSLGFSLWAIGFWLRAVKTRALKFRVLFLATVLVMLFTHPIPLFVLLAFIGAELALRVVQQYIKEKQQFKASSLTGLLSSYKSDLLTGLLAYCAVGYIALFVNTHQTAQNIHHRLIQGGMILDFIRLHPLVLIYGGITTLAYRIFLYALLFASIWIAARGLKERWQSRQLVATDLLLIGAVLFGIVYPVFPRSINGSDYFADRLVIYIWIFVMLAAAARLNLSSRFQQVAGAAAVLIALCVLFLIDRQMRPTANNISKIESRAIVAPGSRGMFVDAPIPPESGRLTFDPFVWASARYFRRTNTVMLNAPWLDLAILPVAPAQKLFTNLFPPQILNYPDRFVSLLLRSEEARNLVSPKMDFIIFIGQSDHDPTVVDNLLKREWPHKWACERIDWYSVCGDPNRIASLQSALPHQD